MTDPDAMALRKLLWLSHGHEMLYGDDGEMQCGSCPLDFKRATVAEIEAAFTRRGMERLAAAALRGEPSPDPVREAEMALRMQQRHEDRARATRELREAAQRVIDEYDAPKTSRAWYEAIESLRGALGGAAPATREEDAVTATRYDPKRDLNPHKAAVAAMYLWGERYARQRLGSMGFWDSLTESEKRLCRDLVRRMGEAPNE